MSAYRLLYVHTQKEQLTGFDFNEEVKLRKDWTIGLGCCNSAVEIAITATWILQTCKTLEFYLLQLDNAVYSQHDFRLQ